MPRTIRPRRMPTERQTEPRSSRCRSARSGEPQRGSGTWRASCTPDWTRSSSRGGSPRAQAAGRAPTTTPTTATARRTSTATGQLDVRVDSASQVVGSDRTTGPSVPARCMTASTTTTTPLTTRTTTTPWVVRRTPSDGPADGLAERRRGEHPGEHDELRTEQAVGRGDERGDRQQAPHLDEPGEVERREQEGAEVLGHRADRVDRHLAARQELAAAAAAHRGADGEHAGSRGTPRRGWPPGRRLPGRGRRIRSRCRSKPLGPTAKPAVSPRTTTRPTSEAPRRRTVRARKATRWPVSRMIRTSRRASRCQSRSAR